MHKELTKKEKELRENLIHYMAVLKNNRDKVPLDVLKTKYKKGYDTLCGNLRQTATDYLKVLVLRGIRIHKAYEDECVDRLNRVIGSSGSLKKISSAVYQKQSIEKFEAEALVLRKKILAEVDVLCMEHLALYITRECLENPEIRPEIYCLCNDCILRGNSWIPREQFRTQTK